jgi:hypothetical protein
MMKRIFIAVLLLFAFMAPADAAKITRQKTLATSTGTTLEDVNLTSTVAVYSESIDITKMSSTTAGLLVIEDKAGGAGDVDISTEYSIDGTNFYPAYTTNMAGTLSLEGNIVTALQNVTRYILHTVRQGRYMRYKFDPDADSQISAYLIIEEEN